MQIFSRDGVHSVTVTGIVTPHGLDNKTVLTKLLDEHGVVISGGQGKMAGKMWRWGTMGVVSEARHRRRARGLRNRHPADGLPVQGRGRRERGARRLRQDRQEGASIGSGASLTGGAAT